MPKFMQSLGPETYQRLAIEAKSRDVTVQSLIRTVIVPDWLKAVPSATSTQPSIAKPMIQHTTTLLSQAGVIAEPTRRPYLSTAIGRGRP